MFPVKGRRVLNVVFAMAIVPPMPGSPCWGSPEVVQQARLLSASIQSRLQFIFRYHRERINTEKKAKVVAAAWWT